MSGWLCAWGFTRRSRCLKDYDVLPTSRHQREGAREAGGCILHRVPIHSLRNMRPEQVNVYPHNVITHHSEALSFAETDVLAPPWHERSRALPEMVRIGAPYRDCFSFSLAILNHHDMRSSHESISTPEATHFRGHLRIHFRYGPLSRHSPARAMLSIGRPWHPQPCLHSRVYRPV